MKNVFCFAVLWASFCLSGIVSAQEKETIDLLMVGDSITDFWDNEGRGLEVYKKYYDNGTRKVLNIGVSGDITDQTMGRLQNPVLDKIAPKMIMLMIGTNNMDRGPETTAEYTVQGIRNILAELRNKFPEAKILLLAVFPRAQPETAAVPGKQYRLRIAAINAQLPALADGKVVFFKNINELFLNEDDTLKIDLMPDQLHPNTAGYYLWADAVEPIVSAWTQTQVQK